MKDFEDAMLEVAYKNLESENNRFKDIDTKVIGIITVTGILMTFLTKSASSGNIVSILFILTALSFLGTILLSVSAIRTRWTGAVSTKNLIDELKDKANENQLRGIIATIAESEKSLRTVTNSKAQDLRYAIYALSISVILLILYSLSIFFLF